MTNANLATIIGMQTWCWILPLNGSRRIRAKTKLHKRKPKVIYTDNSLEFGKACEDLSWNHCTSTPHRTETVKGIYPAPNIHEHFTIHKWLRPTAYILTHNLNNLEHIAKNCMSAMTHTDVTTAHH